MRSSENQELPERRPLRAFFLFENGVSGIVLLLIAVLPALEIIARRPFGGIKGVTDMTQHLVLWLTCLGGAITSR